MEAPFAPTETRKWRKRRQRGQKGAKRVGCIVAKSSRPREVDGREESVHERARQTDRVEETRQGKQLGSKYGPVSPTS